MRLIYAEITNFRSISKIKISFEPRCRILLGINESGKSNILRALNLLDPAQKPTAADIRIERRDEEQVTNASVRYVFELEKDQQEKIRQTLASSFADSDRDQPLFKTPDGALTVNEWLNKTHQCVLEINVTSGKKHFTSWSPPKTYDLAPGWFINTSTNPHEIELASQTLSFPPGAIRKLTDLAKPVSEPLEEATKQLVYAPIYKTISTLAEQNTPKCIFWRYSEEYLLPSSIDLDTFTKNPETCIPLKSMFELAGYDSAELAKTISKARQQGHYRYVQILEKVSDAATKHIQKTWKEYGNVRIKLEANGTALAPVVSDDQVPLDMSNRSDGFKRFVSFLLFISARVHTSEISDSLILIDEPEIALHPSGCRYLRDELIKIAETNYVVYSTHSIFMVDKDDIEKHLIVEKKKEVTTASTADTARIQDEEVLYSALGYSLFETLKPKNLIFEGWRDKTLFVTARAALSKNDAKLRERMSGVGITHATGVKDIKNVARFMELAGRPCLIISDADNAAIQHRKQYLESEGWGTWVTIAEILNSDALRTAEDLLTTKALIDRANKFRSQVDGLKALTEDKFAEGRATLPVLTDWLAGAGLRDADLQEKMNSLKAALFNKLKRSELKDAVDDIVRFVDKFAGPHA
jgi:predicted ATPase